MVKTLNFSSEKLLSVDYIWTVLYMKPEAARGPQIVQVRRGVKFDLMNRALQGCPKDGVCAWHCLQNSSAARR